MKKIAILNHKGGVGKTTTCLHLSSALARKGKKVLMVDFDPQTNLTDHSGIEDPEYSIVHAMEQGVIKPITIHENLDLLAGDMDLSDLEQKYMGQNTAYVRLKLVLDNISDYDYVFIDLPPSLGYFTQNALNAASHILLTTTPTRLSLKGIPKALHAVETSKLVNPNLQLLGILVSDHEKLKVSTEHLKELHEASHLNIFKTIIRHYVGYKNASYAGTTVFEMYPNQEKYKDYINLAEELLNKGL